MSHAYHVIVLISKFSTNMDVQHVSGGCAFSESSLGFQTRQQELSALQFDFPNKRTISTGHNSEIAISEERRLPQPSHLSWTLPQKRTNQSLTSRRFKDAEESHPRTFSGIHSSKRLKGPISSPLPRPSLLGDNVVTTGLSQPLPYIPRDQLDFERPRTLRSPFEYTQEPVTSQFDPSEKTDVQQFDPNRPVVSEKPSGYVYAPVYPSGKADQRIEAHRRPPRRQLSYGDPPSRPQPKSLHKTTGSRELRQKAERHAEDYNLAFWLDGTLNTSATRHSHSEPIRSKTRYWLGLSEREDIIQEAVSGLKLARIVEVITEVTHS